MSITIIIIEIAAMCILFAAAVLIPQALDPALFVTDYPPEIQEEYYRSQKKERERRRISVILVLKKILTALLLMFLFAWMEHAAGAETYTDALILSLIFITALTSWDTFFLDWIIFPRWKRLRLPGTEHMEKEYRQKLFHVKAILPVIPVFLAASLVIPLIMKAIW